MFEHTSEEFPNRIYYFSVGIGEWIGTFTMKVINWRSFIKDNIGLWNHLFVCLMVISTRLLGTARITSVLTGRADEGEAGVVHNEVYIKKLGVTLYYLSETYVLNRDGNGVKVNANERFGPIPFLFNKHKTHPANISNEGMTATYYIPLLGTQWVASYHVRGDRIHIDSTMICDWGEAHERIDKLQE